jgi:UDP-N-acetylglucosamine 4,6-dehydratase
MEGGEVFVPKIPSMRVVELAKAMAPTSRIEVVGIRGGEKLHEVLISEDEARHTIELDEMFVVQPAEALWFGYAWNEKGRPMPEGFRYRSDTNDRWLSAGEMLQLIAPFEASGEGG